ncbi:MAG: hypothetical protein AVDCRST_MAG53-2244, partial [uncultured Solirubrobacteraceae bacterium]
GRSALSPPRGRHRPPHARIPRALRRGLRRAGGGRLLLARRRRRPCARPDPAHLPDRRPALRTRGDDLRRGRLPASRPRRLDGLRALRLQRAVELRRGLGGPAGLHPAPRGLRPDRDELRRRLLRTAWRRAPGADPVRRDHLRRRHRDDPGLLHRARATPGHPGDRRSRAAGRSGGARAGDVLLVGGAHRPDRTRANPPVGGGRLRARSGHRRAHRVGVCRGAVRGSRDQSPGPAAPGHHRDGQRRGGLRRHLARGAHRSAGGRRPDAPRRGGTRSARAGHHGRLPPSMAGRRADLRVRRRGGPDARGGGRIGDARAVAAGVLALAQPPDTERSGAAAPHARHPVRRHRRRGGRRRRARDSPGPRLPRRPLRVRGPDRAAARALERDRAALPRARPPPALHRAVLGHLPRRPAPAARRARSGAGGGRLRQRARPPRGGPVRRGGVDGSGYRAVRRVSRKPGQLAGQAGDGARVRAAPRPRADRRARGVRLDPRSHLRQRARRRHHADRGPAGRGRARRLRRRARRADRGAVGVRGAHVAADRRAAARRPAQARAHRSRAGQGGGGGVRERRSGDGHRAGPQCRARDRRRGPAARRRGDRDGRRGADAHPRRRAAWRARRRERELRRRGDQVRAGQGDLPGDPHRSRGQSTRNTGPAGARDARWRPRSRRQRTPEKDPPV